MIRCGCMCCGIDVVAAYWMLKLNLGPLTFGPRLTSSASISTDTASATGPSWDLDETSCMNAPGVLPLPEKVDRRQH